jgi:hypothetical protein
VIHVVTAKIAAQGEHMNRALATAFFIPDRFHSDAPQMIHGIHQAFLVLGGLTILSTIVFRELKSGDGDTVSQQKIVRSAG